MPEPNETPMIILLGPTATGKTRLAAELAFKINGEVISADSRQVYQGMDLGTGKDLMDYQVEGKEIPHHLIDIVEPGYEYNVYEFQKDFLKAYKEIRYRKHLPILCGGTGMYIESVIKRYRMLRVPENRELRDDLGLKSMDELRGILGSKRLTHNVTDTLDRQRLIRAIEISTYQQNHPHDQGEMMPEIPYLVFGIQPERRIVRARITQRLIKRLQEGMIEEVRQLLELGLKPEQLMFYGLEYKFLTLYVTGKLSYEDMFRQLNTAIHQFAKRQMTWFRRMERQGINIHWLVDELSNQGKIQQMLMRIKEKSNMDY